MIPAERKTFKYCRVLSPGDVPPVDPHRIDVAMLDLNFEYPNLGHDSLVNHLAAVESELRPQLETAGLALRVISYEVRRRRMLPEPPPGRFELYIGTGGPGHVDPAQNDGQAPWSQRVAEDPAWEAPAHRLFDAILADPGAAMLGICHSFGVLCRWLGVARPVLRGPEKGKSTGIQRAHLTDECLAHPWFGRFAAELPDGRRASVADSRLFDLIPDGCPVPPGVTILAHEVLRDGTRGPAITMLEVARDPGGVMPRFLAVNHHPEIHDAALQLRLIRERVAGGNVSPEWCTERLHDLEALLDPMIGPSVRLTARMTLLDPLRFHVGRLVLQRLSGVVHRELRMSSTHQ
jgi:hypothetical protein